MRPALVVLLLLLGTGCMTPVDDAGCTTIIDDEIAKAEAPGFYLLGAWAGDVVYEDGCTDEGRASVPVWWARWSEEPFPDAVQGASLTPAIADELTLVTDALGLLACVPSSGDSIECAGFRRREAEPAVVIVAESIGGQTVSRRFGEPQRGVFTDVELPPAASD